MIRDYKGLVDFLINKAKEYGQGAKKMFVAVSGGVDSATVAALLCSAFGPENVFGMYRDIESDPKNLEYVEKLQKAFGFNLIFLDVNDEYHALMRKMNAELVKLGIDDIHQRAEESFKSRMTTPLASYISKAIDNGNGRIFGTGNGEEDGLLRYFDKFGDGAVDSNLLAGLTKAEVRQLALHLGVPEEIVVRKPSADLQGNGEEHNDEAQLSQWAHEMGYDISLSYGDSHGKHEGNIAWAWKQELEFGAVTDHRKFPAERLIKNYGTERAKLLLFIRKIERATRHKALGISGTDRQMLLALDLVGWNF